MKPYQTMVTFTSIQNRKWAILIRFSRYLNEGLRERTEYVHNYETEKITHKASDAAEYIELFGSFT